MIGRALNSEQLIVELERRALELGPSALAFDADGTLWSGDVGEDVFRFAVQRGRLRENARAELERQARARGFQPFADANDTAQQLFEAYLAGRYPEREICELMTFCYAGHSLAEMRALVAEALVLGKIADRLHPELGPVLAFARARGLRAIVVSASPRIAVEEAAKLWGFSAADIAASTPRVVAGVIESAMADAVPYAATKVSAGRALLGDVRWLASFGDNVFDLEMLRVAEIAVAVRPKPALEARLSEIPGVVLLSPEIS